MRERVVRVRHADLRDTARGARLPRHHEREDARQVGLDTPARSRSNISRACSSKVAGMPRRLLDDRQLRGALLLGLLDAPLDVAHRLQVLGQLRAVAARPGRACSAATLVASPKSRMLRSCLEPRQPRRRIGAVAAAEQPLEHRARVVLHRQRRRRRAPGDRVGVRAAVAGVARAQRCRRCRAPARATPAASPCPGASPRSDPSRSRPGCPGLRSSCARTPVSHGADARAWSPTPSPTPAAVLSTGRSRRPALSRNGSSGSRIGDSANSPARRSRRPDRHRPCRWAT